ncbi:MAG: hypothetical protein KAS32_14340 [Candidatus Peribacteraceae bacterium]|nr:hypothetical protein [Candidatus Peribacteraceae bacterium]
MIVQQLFEGISQKLFHSTNLDAFLNIVKTNQFKLSPDIGSERETSLTPTKRKNYFLSTSRSKQGSFQVAKWDSLVTINLDGRKLSYNYSGKAVDYFSPESRKSHPRGFESEDRIFSNKPTIPNALKYFEEVHIFVSMMRLRDREKSQLRKVILMLKKNNVPYWLYSEQSAFQQQNKNKAIEISELKLGKKGISSSVSREDFPSNISRPYRDTINSWIELYYKNSINMLSDYTKSELPYIMTHSQDKNSVAKLRSSVDKLRRKGGIDRKLVDRLVKILHTEHMKDVNQLVPMLVDKWTEIAKGR